MSYLLVWYWRYLKMSQKLFPEAGREVAEVFRKILHWNPRRKELSHLVRCVHGLSIPFEYCSSKWRQFLFCSCSLLNCAQNTGVWGMMFYTLSLIFVVIDYYKSWESYNILYLTDTINSQTSGNKSLLQVSSILPPYLMKQRACALKSLCHRG